MRASPHRSENIALMRLFFTTYQQKKSLTQFWNRFMVQYFMHDFETKVLEDMPLHLKILKHIKKKFSQLRVFPV